ncbi:unnamed protein product, partial [Owenia fusiformis]
MDADTLSEDPIVINKAPFKELESTYYNSIVNESVLSWDMKKVSEA